MANKDCNTILTESFSDSDTFVRARNARVLCDADGRVLGSVSDANIYDLHGNAIAEFKAESTRKDNDENDIRVAEYASETRAFLLEDDYLYAVKNGVKRYIGQVRRKERNRVHIIVLSVLAALLIATVILIALIAIPAKQPEGEVPVIDIKDKNGTWEAQGVVAVFSDGIRPGSNGEYGFVLNNPNSTEMEYAFYLEPRYEGIDTDYFPVLFRLRMNNVLMETEEWRSVDELRYDRMVILGGTSQVFTLEWSWPFDAGNDDKDTIIGADGGKISIVLHLTAQSRESDE